MKGHVLLSSYISIPFPQQHCQHTTLVSVKGDVKFWSPWPQYKPAQWQTQSCKVTANKGGLPQPTPEPKHCNGYNWHHHGNAHGRWNHFTIQGIQTQNTKCKLDEHTAKLKLSLQQAKQSTQAPSAQNQKSAGCSEAFSKTSDTNCTSAQRKIISLWLLTWIFWETYRTMQLFLQYSTMQNHRGQGEKPGGSAGTRIACVCLIIPSDFSGCHQKLDTKLYFHLSPL